MGTIRDVNVNLYLYLFISLTAGIAITVQKIFVYCQPIDLKLKGKPVLFQISLIVFILAVIFQTYTQAHMFNNTQRLFANKTVEQKNELIYPTICPFAHFYLYHLPGKHWCDLMTDYSLSDLEPWALSYYLYPQIDVLIQKDHPKDCTIMFNKEGAIQLVPTDYKILEFDQYNLIAIKKPNE